MSLNKVLYDEIKLNNPGVLKTRLSNEIFERLKEDSIQDSKNKIPYNKNLVGQIDGEYQIEVRPYFERAINDMWIEYRDRFQYCLHNEYYIPKTAWINIQKKHEFNPVHHHDGAVAWVVWLKIPYDLEEELNLFPDAKIREASLFSFYYNRFTGYQSHFPLYIDKEWEGTMIMFPAMLKHSVNPFYTSDEMRISIAGNITAYE